MSEYKNSFDKAKKDMVDRAFADSENQINDKIYAESRPHCFSDEHNEKMKKFFAEFESKKTKKYPMVYKIVACILGFVIIGSSVTVATVDAFRESFLNFFFEPDEPNTDFGSANNKGFFYSDDNIFLEYVPYGFEMQECSVNSMQGLWLFGGNSKFFQVVVTEPEAGMSIDTEGGSFEKIVVQDVEGIYTSNDNINSVVFNTKDKTVVVLGDVEKLELLQIANGLIFNRLSE